MANIELLVSKGLRIQEDAQDLLEKCDSGSLKFLLMSEGFVTLADVERAISLQKQELIQKPLENKRTFRITNWEPSSTRKGKVDSFLSYFRNRYKKLKRLLRQRISDFPVLDSFDKAKNFGGKLRAIGMVTECKATRNGNMLITLEDESGELPVIVSKDSKAFEKSKQVLHDEVLAIDGRMSNGFLMASELVYPDLPIKQEVKTSGEDAAILYLSDLHVGSRFFMEREFRSMLAWLNGRGEGKELAEKIRYIIIAGDIVDGVGIYPKQETELVITDVFKQYSFFDELMCEIPDRIEIFVAPGNHDAVRRAEPQPMLPAEFFTRRIHRLTNPSWLEIEGLKHLVYHGTSMDSIIASLEHCDYIHPDKTMIELLKRRHLSPIYGENLIAPGDEDHLVIDNEPDIVHMGHMHKNAYSIYRGVVLLNSGTFQEQTEFQLRMGHVPSPCLVPVFECKTGKVQHVHFHK